MTPRSALALLVAASLALASGCAPRAVRGGAGTDRPDLDQPALGVGLDREDIDYLVSENLASLEASRFWTGTVRPAVRPPTVAIWPIENRTTQHLDEQLLTILSSIETTLVNGGDVRVVARNQQEALAEEIRRGSGSMYDPGTAQRAGRLLGAQYFVTGRVTSVDEKLASVRRLQYSLFLQALDVETGLVLWQNEVTRTKQLKR